MIVFLISFATCIYLLYKWSTSTYDYFEKQGIPFRKPVAFFGTNINTILRKESFLDSLNRWYNEFPNEK